MKKEITKLNYIYFYTKTRLYNEIRIHQMSYVQQTNAIR